MSNLRVGVIYWDRTGSSKTYFGHHITNTLSPKKFRDRTPYYADIEAEDKVSFHVISQEEYDRELEYAVEAGIDYFAYTWNSSEKNDRREFIGTTEELLKAQLDEEDNTRRRLHAKSRLRDKIKLCAYILCGNKYSDADVLELMNEMKQDHYEKIDFRPLVILYGGYNPEWIERLNKAADENGVNRPYIAFENTGSRVPDGDCSKADAVTAYSFLYYRKSDDDTYRDFYTRNIEVNENRMKSGIRIIPHFSFGWDPSPRIERPVPWYSGYERVRYMPKPSPDELKTGADMFCGWIEANKNERILDHILIFAWNEFEEGAWICPTYDEKLGLDTSRIAALRDIVGSWKERLC